MRTKIVVDLGDEKWCASSKIDKDKEESIIERTSRGQRERLALKIEGRKWRLVIESGDVRVSYKISGDRGKGTLEYEGHGQRERIGFENGKLALPDPSAADRNIRPAPTGIGSYPAEVGMIFATGGAVFAPNTGGGVTPAAQACVDEAKRRLKALGNTVIKGAATSAGLSLAGALGILAGGIFLFGLWNEVEDTQEQILADFARCLDDAKQTPPPR